MSVRSAFTENLALRKKAEGFGNLNILTVLMRTRFLWAKSSDLRLSILVVVHSLKLHGRNLVNELVRSTSPADHHDADDPAVLHAGCRQVGDTLACKLALDGR